MPVANRTYHLCLLNGFNSHITKLSWKDTFLEMPGDPVKLLRHFDDLTGLFLSHRHNLEYEDMGLIRNCRVDP